MALQGAFMQWQSLGSLVPSLHPLQCSIWSYISTPVQGTARTPISMRRIGWVQPLAAQRAHLSSMTMASSIAVAV